MIGIAARRQPLGVCRSRKESFDGHVERAGQLQQLDGFESHLGAEAAGDRHLRQVQNLCNVNLIQLLLCNRTADFRSDRCVQFYRHAIDRSA